MSNNNTDNQNNTEELEEGSRNILLAIAGQLTKGMDLQRVALPTFVLEPRSMLERITDFMSIQNCSSVQARWTILLNGLLAYSDIIFLAGISNQRESKNHTIQCWANSSAVNTNTRMTLKHLYL
ncbi:unnamed protein product [Absidia cylindrospora]